MTGARTAAATTAGLALVFATGFGLGRVVPPSEAGPHPPATTSVSTTPAPADGHPMSGTTPPSD